MYRLIHRVSLRHIEADDSYWAFDLENGSHYELNEAAFLVLSGLVDGADSEALGRKLAAEYDIDPGAAAADVESMLTELRNLGLLQEEGAS